MTDIFAFEDFRKYLSAWIAGQGDNAYGMKGRIAKNLNISSTLVSLILQGKKTFSSDQASDLNDFLGHDESESDYLHLLIELDRAGNHRYKEKLLTKIRHMKKQSSQLAKRIRKDKELSEEQKAIYYSSWLYTGIRNLVAIDKLNTAPAVAKHLNLEISTVAKVFKFLIENQFCKEEKGKMVVGPQQIFMDKNSSFVNRQHQNWRFQALQQMENKKDADLFFTSPMSLSKEAFAEIRAMLPNFIQNIMKIVGPSESEVAACLNIDWFGY